MLGQGLETGCPVRINRPVRLKISAQPFLKFRSAFIGLHFHSIVNADQAGSTFHFRLQLLEVIGLNSRVAAASIGIKHNGVGFVEFIGGWPFAGKVSHNI